MTIHTAKKGSIALIKSLEAIKEPLKNPLKSIQIQD